jgi:hypothetical protein
MNPNNAIAAVTIATIFTTLYSHLPFIPFLISLLSSIPYKLVVDQLQPAAQIEDGIPLAR